MPRYKHSLTKLESELPEDSVLAYPEGTWTKLPDEKPEDLAARLRKEALANKTEIVGVTVDDNGNPLVDANGDPIKLEAPNASAPVFADGVAAVDREVDSPVEKEETKDSGSKSKEGKK